MFKIQPESKGNNLYIVTEGVLTHKDYEAIMPELEELHAQQGKLNCVIDVTGWEGWEWRAVWDDFVVGMRHFSDYGRLAIIGRDDQKWMEWFGKFYDMFRGDETRFFDASQKDAALKWGFTGQEPDAEQAA